MAGDNIPLETERGYHVMLTGLDEGPRNSLMAADRKFVVNWMNGGLRAAGLVEFAALDAKPDWERAKTLLTHLRAMFPTLPLNLPADRIRMWQGNRPSLPDGRPCIGHATSTKDVVYAFGHGHIGLVGSARTGRVVAQLVGQQEPEIPLQPFNPQRFG